MKFPAIIFLFSVVFADPIKVPFVDCDESLKSNIAKSVGNYPFPTDMTFRNFADHRIDITTQFFDPNDVEQGDTIYLSDFHISWFVANIHPLIRGPYILISSDSDYSHPATGTSLWSKQTHSFPMSTAVTTLLYDPKVAYWFCKNMVLSNHPKISQIPIGQNVILWGDFPQKEFFLGLSVKESAVKKHLLYMSMQLGCHPSRPLIAQQFQDEPYCFSSIKNLKQNFVPRNQFYEELSASLYTLAPPGGGLDIVRFWEAVALGCIPIVQHSELDELYEGLPALLVNDWSEINEHSLELNFSKISAQKISVEKAYFPYWAARINEVKRKVQSDGTVFSSIDLTRFPSKTLDDLLAVFRQQINPSERLVCMGAAMGVRPSEISQKFSLNLPILIEDLWSLPDLIESVHSSYQRQFKVKKHFFLDLTYHKHQLKKNLFECFAKSEQGALICGNRGNDPYVQSIVTQHSQKYIHPLFLNGDIWFFIK